MGESALPWTCSPPSGNERAQKRKGALRTARLEHTRREGRTRRSFEVTVLPHLLKSWRGTVLLGFYQTKLCAKSPEGAHPCRSPHNDHTGQAPWTGLCSELFRHIKARFITRQLSRRGCSVIPTFWARQRGHGEAKSGAPGLTEGVQRRASDSKL